MADIPKRQFVYGRACWMEPDKVGAILGTSDWTVTWTHNGDLSSASWSTSKKQRVVGLKVRVTKSIWFICVFEITTA